MNTLKWPKIDLHFQKIILTENFKKYGKIEIAY